ncbi:hypothetical protein CPU12_00215 [Malaciobacter molluscorum LMG 25693]|uniref:Membrane protein n=1 Tax=Malaciobacter molluscorum LMG 25693 TaxID=870501 RepID=A0A2G1DL89_9BACT|nr:hypothetical protein [Malaciobacter molluscorum]AXX92008.1 putative membrane protein [Malaciobacter molluscorum LMG 25693]PHO19241.1 hypothetical protein CPU12_00215 [Malaciobacter molluscorum LMG 25693]RXJ96495.1 hypothetical protein CRV00_02450 [Malaciobacter molluscorum]
MKKNKKIKLKREIEKPIKVFGKQLKLTRVLLILIVGLIYFISLYFEIRTLTPLIIGIIPAILFIIALIVYQNRIIYFGNYSIECSNAGDLYLTKLKGRCPTCDGQLKIVKKFNTEYIQCQNNSEHKFYLEVN